VYLNAFRDGKHLLRIDVEHLGGVMILYKRSFEVGLFKVPYNTAGFDIDGVVSALVLN
jgi:hypothetical protein